MHKIHYVIIIWEKSECLHIGFIDYISLDPILGQVTLKKKGAWSN